MKNLLVGQSGGPTSVINASLAGVIKRGIESRKIGEILGTVNGIEGILNDNIISLDDFTPERIALLKQTPSSYLGSCRKKLPDSEKDEDIYKKIFDTFKKHNVGYFLYIGGNDSMDTVKKLSAYAADKNIDIQVIGVPKTIDNDLFLTDHTPGFGSAAKFIVNSIRQLALDTDVYDMKSVVILEIMGRNAGWLTAAAALANSDKLNPVDIICLPEVTFSPEKFIEKLKNVMKKKSTTIIAVSEGIKGEDERYIAECGDIKRAADDGFAHAALGGVGKTVEKLISDELGIKTRSIELSTLQRCFSLAGSKVDVEEAFAAGSFAIELAEDGKTAVMAGFKRISDKPYAIELAPFDINDVANFEKGIPKDMIAEDGLGVNEKFIAYAKPLIAGELPLIFDEGLIQFEIR